MGVKHFHIQRETKAEGVSKEGAEENVWASDRGNRGLDGTA
jgi:hypothetical protein